MQKLKKWLLSLWEHRKDWPILVSSAVIFLNIELVVTPYILHGIFGLSGKDLSMSAGIWSSVELGWWVWFSLWIFKKKIRKINAVNEAINVGKEVIEEVDWDSIFMPKPVDSFPVRKAKVIIRNHIKDFDLARHQEDQGFMILFSFAKGLGYILACFLVFIFALLPLFWTLGLMICRLARWRLAYIFLFSGNFIKNYFLASMYEKIGFWWLLLLFVILVLVISFCIKRALHLLRTKSLSKNHR